ncbi:MAG: deoxynucleoside kinase [Chitinophagales bacterium]|nr:deoxynucleoside kinase [Chitinophagales bacterium]MDW8420013.1 deoxynucleoside kinase [Chitinophagales bacterium]
MQYRFVTVEGAIGAGKTTLATMLARDYNAHLILEQFENNPFLPKFYADKERYAFPVELYFMAERYQHLKQLLSQSDIFKSFTISDFLFQKSLIFAIQNLNDDEEKLYRTLFDIINPSLPKPDLIVYLHAPVSKLLQNIKKRGRPYEQQISPEYLENIQAAYMSYFRSLTGQRIVLVDCTRLDWIARPEDYIFMKNLLEQPYEPGIHYR